MDGKSQITEVNNKPNGSRKPLSVSLRKSEALPEDLAVMKLPFVLGLISLGRRGQPKARFPSQADQKARIWLSEFDLLRKRASRPHSCSENEANLGSIKEKPLAVLLDSSLNTRFYKSFHATYGKAENGSKKSGPVVKSIKTELVLALFTTATFTSVFPPTMLNDLPKFIYHQTVEDDDYKK